MRIISGGRYYLLILLVIFFALDNRKVLALTASIGPDGCNAQAVHALGYTGQGVLVGVFSMDHARVTHEAFHGKDSQGYPTGASYAAWFDATGESLYETSYHDTAMAGIVGSRGGQLYPAEIGVAPNCSILSVRLVDSSSQIGVSYIEAGLDELLDRGGRVVVTGIQFPPADPFVPNGDSQYSLMYDYYAYTETKDILFINASGNDYSGVTVFGDGFNGLTTGGLIMPETGVYRQVGTASNPGPTADGRRKPEITAPAQTLRVPVETSDTAWAVHGTTRGETSWAGPHAAGVAALLLQYANSTTTISDDNKSAVIKAVMVNSTFPNIKNKTGQITTGQTWNAHRGYGRVDAWRAYHELSSPKVSPGVSVPQSQTTGWSYQKMNSSPHTYSIYGHKNQRLLVTVTWHRRITRGSSNGVYSAEGTPFNVNLSIHDPLGNEIFSDADTPDNLRKADIILPSDGYCQVRVENSSSRTGRYYAMAFELLEPLEADFNADSIVDTSDLVTLAGFDSWLAINCTNPAQACYWYDLTADGRIDFEDMSILSVDWLSIDPRYYPVP